jgi:hypothetical protein
MPGEAVRALELGNLCHAALVAVTSDLDPVPAPEKPRRGAAMPGIGRAEPRRPERSQRAARGR